MALGCSLTFGSEPANLTAGLATTGIKKPLEQDVRTANLQLKRSKSPEEENH